MASDMQQHGTYLSTMYVVHRFFFGRSASPAPSTHYRFAQNAASQNGARTRSATRVVLPVIVHTCMASPCLLSNLSQHTSR